MIQPAGNLASESASLAVTGAWQAATAAVIALALLAIVTIVWRRSGGGLPSLLAGLVAVASLWGMHAPLTVEREVSPRAVRLVTAGGMVSGPELPGGKSPEASSAAVSTRADLRRAALEAFAVSDAVSVPRARVVPDARWLLRHRPEVATVRVSGHGLLASDWSGLPWRVEADPPPSLARGVKRLIWSRQLELGSELVVRGALSACAECREVLLGGAATVAGARRAVAIPDADGAFELRVRPRSVGQFLPELLAVDAAGSPLVRQTFDVVVTAPRPPAVLWLERAPSFESRAVRRWREGLAKSERAGSGGGAAAEAIAAGPAADGGSEAIAAGSVAGGGFEVRSTWSRDRVRTSLLGGSAVAPGRRSFSEFDVVVVDVESLRDLGAARAQALRQAVRDDGVGLLLRLEEGRLPESEPLLAGFTVRAIGGLDELLARVAWPGFEATQPLAITGHELVLGAKSAPLVVDQADRVLAALNVEGAGAVGISLLQGTYRWTLAGEVDTHARVWSRLLQAVARPRTNAWLLPSAPALVDLPFDVVLTAAIPPTELSCREPDGATVDLPFATSREEPSRARARLWPRLGGWHTCSAAGSGARTDTTFYAHPASSWPVWLAARRQDDTAVAVVMTAQPDSDGTEGNRPPVRRPVVRRPVELPRWPLYVAFLVSVGYLWLAERWGVGKSTVSASQ